MKGLYFSRLRITHGIVMLSETAKPMKRVLGQIQSESIAVGLKLNVIKQTQ